MSTFVYVPGLKVYIDSYRLGTVVDVSDSVVGLEMVRLAGEPSTLSFALTNPMRKYDNVFTPNDRIVVMMKRLTWMRTFTGYLNQVPVFSSWPRDVTLTASCSLKRLQYFYWDPNLKASAKLVRDSLRNQEDGSPPDGGIKQAVINLLEEVVDWSGAMDQARGNGDKSLAGSKIHIGEIPRNWFDLAAKLLPDIAENVLEQQTAIAGLFARLGGSATLAGEGSISQQGTIAQGTANLNPTQNGHAKKILDAAFAYGATAREAEMVMACVAVESNFYQWASDKYAESRLIPHDKVGRDYDSVGFFQQRPSQGWGTVAECMDITHSTKAFLDRLRKIKNRDSLPFTEAVASVQRPRKDLRYKYGERESQAKAIVAAYLGSVRTLGGDPSFPGADQLPGAPSTGVPQTSVANPRQAERQDSQRKPQQQGTTTSAQICTKAQQLVAMKVPYRFGSTTRPDDPNPRDHDCSSFVEWVYFQSLGVMNGIPSQSQAQYEWSRTRGREITVEQGLNTPGALLFRSRGNLAIGHVEISLGDGGRSIGTRRTGTDASEVSTRASYWSHATLMPGVNYPNQPPAIPATGSGDVALTGPMATADPTIAAGQAIIDSSAAAAQSVLSGTQIGASLFGSQRFMNLAEPPDSGFAEQMKGIRALQNDEPILPYVSNLLNASLRQFCSAPNGDFMAWFPDYYGLWGTAAKMVLEPIEVKDFTVTFSDEYLVTHQFVAAVQDGTQLLNLGTGAVDIEQTNLIARLSSWGIATIDQPSIMSALLGIEMTDDELGSFQEEIYKRYGPRNNYTEVAGISGNDGEFFMALYLFMQNWTAAWNANIDITFMPELWPGMIIQFPKYNFQAYVNTVQHSVTYGPGGGFRTTINIQAPSRIKDMGSNDDLKYLPLAGAKGSIGVTGSKAVGKAKQPAGRAVASNPRLERF